MEPKSKKDDLSRISSEIIEVRKAQIRSSRIDVQETQLRSAKVATARDLAENKQRNK